MKSWNARAPRHEKLFTLRLTRAEWNHVLTAISDQKDRGEYWGRKDQFHNRVDRIIAKLEEALKNE